MSGAGAADLLPGEGATWADVLAGDAAWWPALFDMATATEAHP